MFSRGSDQDPYPRRPLVIYENPLGANQQSGYNRAHMRLLLQQRPTAGEIPKYVQLILQQDLLGGWSLLRETGQIGGKASLKREQFLDQDAALSAFERARDAQVKRGFQVVFAQGANAPQ